jgi:hypothetical protein
MFFRWHVTCSYPILRSSQAAVLDLSEALSFDTSVWDASHLGGADSSVFSSSMSFIFSKYGVRKALLLARWVRHGQQHFSDTCYIYQPGIATPCKSIARRKLRQGLTCQKVDARR